MVVKPGSCLDGVSPEWISVSEFTPTELKKQIRKCSKVAQFYSKTLEFLPVGSSLHPTRLNHFKIVYARCIKREASQHWMFYKASFIVRDEGTFSTTDSTGVSPASVSTKVSCASSSDSFKTLPLSCCRSALTCLER